MKHHAVAAGLALVGALTTPHAVQAQGFEGVLQLREIEVNAEAFMEFTGRTPESIFDITVDELLQFGNGPDADSAGFEIVTLFFSMKGARSRIDSPEGTIGGPGGYATIDTDAGQFRVILPSNGAFAEWTLDDLARLQPDYTPPDLSLGESHANPTGTGATAVNGYACREFRVAVETEVKIACMSDALQDAADAFRRTGIYARTMNFGDPPSEMERHMANEVSALMAQRGFPILMFTLDDEKFSVNELISVERSALADSLFAAPPSLMKLPLEVVIGGG